MPRFNRDFIPEIQDKWFKGHQAHVTECMLADGRTSLTAIDWARPDTCVYGVRYLLCGNTLAVSGDLGSAIFSLTEPASLERLAKYDISYLRGKLRCCDCGTNGIDFDSDLAVAFLGEYFRSLADDEDDADNPARLQELCAELTNEAISCASKDHWSHILARHADELSSYDADWYEALPCCGDTYCIQIVAFLVGLRMANELLHQQMQVPA